MQTGSERWGCALDDGAIALGVGHARERDCQKISVRRETGIHRETTLGSTNRTGFRELRSQAEHTGHEPLPILLDESRTTTVSCTAVLALFAASTEHPIEI